MLLFERPFTAAAAAAESLVLLSAAIFRRRVVRYCMRAIYYGYRTNVYYAILHLY